MRYILLLTIGLGLVACGDTGTTTPDGENCSSDDLLILGSMASTLIDTSTTCAFGCSGGEGTLGDCTSECVAGETGLSATCSSCFGIIIECVFENCISSCIDPDDEACTACIESEGCNDAFEECSGVSPSLDGACADDLGTLVEQIDTIVETTTTCGTGCITSEDGISSCTAECVATEAGISVECSMCFGDLSECTITMCATPCLEGTDAPDCVSCIEDMGCNSGFEECAGFSPDIAN